MIGRNEQRQFHADDMIEKNRQVADWDATLIEGVGHFLLLEKPDEVSAAIRAAVAEIRAAD